MKNAEDKMQKQPTDPIPVEEMLDGDGQPHWERITLDVLCSRCGYNVRGLAQPRCPECGLQFEWRDLLSGLGRTTNWLFEHNWLEKPLRSWLMTVAAEMRGRAFWRQLSIHHHVTPGPLLVMMLAAPLMTVVVSLCTAFLLSQAIPFVVGLMPAESLREGDPGRAIMVEFAHMCAQFSSFVVSPNGGFLALPASVALIYGLLAAGLCCYREWLESRRLRTVHMLRVVAHAAFPAGIAMGLLPPLMLLLSAIILGLSPDHGYVLTLAVFVSVPTIMGATVGSGLRHYLGRRSGVVTAVVSTIPVMLFFALVATGVAVSFI